MKKLILALLLLSINLSIIGQEFFYKIKVNNNNKIEGLDRNKKLKLDKVLDKYKHDKKDLILCYPNAKNKDLLNYYTYRGRGDKKQFKKEMEGLAIFQSVEQEQMFSIDCTDPVPPVNDTWIANNWANNYALEMIEANCAWSITKGSSGILIGIADTQFEDTHEDLENQIITVHGSLSGGNTHGTMVAGCAAAETNNNKGIAGIGYKSKIVANCITHHSGGYTSSSYIREAIWNLYQEGVDIINVSWSGSGLDIAATEEIIQSGITLCLAAGNNPTDMNHSSIANIPGVILVSSVDSDNKHGPTGHAHNQYVDICAPGTNVTTTKAESPYYGGAWGTSFASPIVVGVCALIKSIDPCLSPAMMEGVIEANADPVADASQYPGILGAGRINAYKCVLAVGTKSTSVSIGGTATYMAGYLANLNNVAVQSNSNITIKARNEINISGTFDVPVGSSITMEINANTVNSCNW